MIFSPLYVRCKSSNLLSGRAHHKRKKVKAHQIEEAVAHLKGERPAYKELLDFYKELFLAQERAESQVSFEPIHLSEDLLNVKKKEGFPLIDRAEFPIDLGVCEALLKEICELARKANEALAETALKLAENLKRKTLDVSVLFSRLLSEDDTFFHDLSEELRVDKKMLAFLIYSSVRPCLTVCAEQLAGYVDDKTARQKGYCPVCGGSPALAVLRDEGVRSLLCGFCGHEWKTSRIYCPFCENRNHKTLCYFFSDEEKDYRVNVCEECKKYLKTVDTRKMTYPFCPMVEQIATLHLDLLAREQGLESGSPLWLPT